MRKELLVVYAVIGCVWLYSFSFGSTNVQDHPVEFQERQTAGRTVQQVGKDSSTPAVEIKPKPAVALPVVTTPVYTPPERAPRTDSGARQCGETSPLFQMADDGKACMLPFKLNNTWYSDCELKSCATTVDILSRAIQMSPCTIQSSLTKKELTCKEVTGAVSCESHEAEAATCDTPLGNLRRVSGVCHCSNGIKKAVTCDDPITYSCTGFCNTLTVEASSSGHSAAMHSVVPDIVVQLATLSAKHTPIKPTETELNVDKWQQFAKELGTLTPGNWCGRGIVMMAGSVSTFPQALATVAYLRGHFRTNIPVEIWQTEDEVTVYSQPFRNALTQLAVTVRTLPSESQSDSTNEMFALKPAVVLASSFDEVLLLDADSLPLVDPSEIFAMRPSNVSAVFWPDYWTLLWDAKIWDSIGGWPFGEQRHVPSQDSGLMVICKSCGAFHPLALAFYFNYHSQTYYPGIYFGHFQEKRCRGGVCTSGHDVPGMGDKDTFQIAWLALHEQFIMMPPASIGGTLLPKRRLVCGSSFIHRNKKHEAVALHHNSNKWWWKDFAEGRWTSWRTGFLLTHVTSFANESAAYLADGMNDWRSITYSTRHDAGRQQPPPASRWCIVYKGNVVTTTILADIGWDIEKVLVKYYTRLYSSPWMMEWATLSSGSIASASCVKAAGWESHKWLEVASDEDIRNTVISHLSEEKMGTIPFLQSHSDTSLNKLCHNYLASLKNKEKEKVLGIDDKKDDKKEKDTPDDDKKEDDPKNDDKKDDDKKEDDKKEDDKKDKKDDEEDKKTKFTKPDTKDETDATSTKMS